MRLIMLALISALFAVGTIPIHILTGWGFLKSAALLLLSASFVLLGAGIWHMSKEL